MSDKVGAWTRGEEYELCRLLEKVQRSGAHGFEWPPGVRRTLEETICLWVPTLVIERGVGTDASVLLVPYKGAVPQFQGMWCLPHRHNRPNQISLAEVCSDLGREIGVSLELARVLDARKWDPKDGQPHTRHLSLFLYCYVLGGAGNIKESDCLRFARRHQLPQDMLPAHRRFLLEGTPSDTRSV